MNRLITISLVTTLFTGCYNKHLVVPSQLAQLRDSQQDEISVRDGGTVDEKKASAEPNDKQGPLARAPLQARPKQLVDIYGEPIDLKPGVKLYANLSNGNKLGGDVRNTDFRNGQFIWKQKPGSDVVVPIKEVTSAEVDVPDRGRTLLAFFGAAAGVALIVTGILFLGALSHVGGRPLRIDGRVVVARARESIDWLSPAPMPFTNELSSDARAALAAAWLRDARDEHASVPAFSRISLTLVALGAPSRLVEAAHRAALEEIEHARRVFALASAYAERTIGPAPLPELLPEKSGYQGTADEAICQLAVESLSDGCLGEGFAAALAREACARAGDAAVRETLAVIARDEASHADFSWNIVSWCLAVGGDQVREALKAKLQQLPRVIERPSLPSSDAEQEKELEQHGRLNATIQRALFRHIRDETIARASLLFNSR